MHLRLIGVATTGIPLWGSPADHPLVVTVVKWTLWFLLIETSTFGYRKPGAYDEDKAAPLAPYLIVTVHARAESVGDIVVSASRLPIFLALQIST